MWSKQASIPFSFQVCIRSESSMVSRLFVIILFSAVFFLFSLRLLYGSFGHLSLLPVDDWRVCLQVMNFLCFYVSFISQTSSLQLFSSCCCCCCCWRGGWILCCWKTLNWSRGFMIVVGMLCRDLASAHHLWPAHPGVYPRCSRFVQRLVQVSPLFSISQTWCYYCAFF